MGSWVWRAKTTASAATGHAKERAVESALFGMQRNLPEGIVRIKDLGFHFLSLHQVGGECQHVRDNIREPREHSDVHFSGCRSHR